MSEKIGKYFASIPKQICKQVNNSATKAFNLRVKIIKQSIIDLI